MCIAAATGKVNVTLSAPGILDIVDFDFVPFGNAYYSKVTGNTSYDRGPGMTSWLEQCGMGKTDVSPDCFEGPILCQHGPNECQGNLIEGCLKTVLPKAKDYWPWISCFEGQDIDRVPGSGSPLKAMKACNQKHMRDVSKMAALDKCINTPAAAHAVSVANAKPTAALIPAHEGTPWILINGKDYDGDDVLGTVCKAYKGPKPAGCP